MGSAGTARSDLRKDWTHVGGEEASGTKTAAKVDVATTVKWVM